jgi:predicted RNase H-like HicB family nuclease
MEKETITTTAVLITRYNDNHYTARALALSDVIANGASEAEAIAALRSTLAELQARSHIVQVDLPVPAAMPDDPWLRAAGMWAQDPSWDGFQAAMADYRAAINAETADP